MFYFIIFLKKDRNHFGGGGMTMLCKNKTWNLMEWHNHLFFVSTHSSCSTTKGGGEVESKSAPDVTAYEYS